MRMRPRRNLDAAHEAAHAAVATALGFEVVRVALLQGPDIGVCDYEVPLPCVRWRVHEALVCAAGPAADALRGLGQRGRMRAWCSDFAAITEMGFSPKERALVVRLATRMLEGECRALWERLTQALEERDLNAADVVAIALRARPRAPGHPRPAHTTRARARASGRARPASRANRTR